MIRSPRNPKEKVKNGFWLLNPASKIESILLTLFFLFLPTQLGKHFWPDFTIVTGIRIDYLSPTLYVTDVLLFLLFLSFLLRQRKSFKISNLKGKRFLLKAGKSLTEKTHPKYQKLIFTAGLVFLFLVCNVFFSLSPLLSAYGFIKLCECGFLGFYLARTIHAKLQLQQIALLFCFGAIFESILAIVQYINQGSLNGIFYYFGERTFTGVTPGIANASINGVLILRPYATFPHPNVLAGYLLVAMVLVWSFLLKIKDYPIKIFGCISLLLSSIALLLTYSRIGILLWVLLVVMLLFRVAFRTVKTLKIKIISGTAILLVVIVSNSLPITHEVYNRFIHTSLSEESVIERTELLSVSWKMIQKHPIMGVGLYNFIPSIAPLQKPTALNLYLQPVHNIFVLVAVETGIVGLGFLIFLLAATALRVRNLKIRDKWTFFVLLTIIIVTGMFDHYWMTLQQGQLLFATILGVCWTAISV